MPVVASVWHHLDPLFLWIFSRATEHGYASLTSLACLEGIGFPIPAELVILALVVLVRRGTVFLEPAVVLCALGYTLGSLVPYGLGRWGGHKLLTRFLPASTPHRQRLETWISGYGVLTLILTRVTGIFRLAAVILAGTAGMPLSVALPAMFGGAVLWLYFGYHIVHIAGMSVHRIASRDHDAWLDLALVLLLALGALVFYLVRRRRSRR